MQIGELAQQMSLNPRTIRFYESIGVMPEPKRTPGGYRDYDDSDLERIKFIKLAKSGGLPLDDIREILALRDRQEAPCQYVQAVIDREAKNIDRRILEFQHMRAELRRLKALSGKLAGSPADAKVCAILEHQTPPPTN